MRIGVILPHGVWDEFAGRDSNMVWTGMRRVALDAEEIGFESVWLSDHFTSIEPRPDAIVLEALMSLAALASVTRRIRMGTLVLCAAYRNAALTAAMLCTLDAISGGRAELGIGAGWKEDEFRAFGYGFPDTVERLAILADHLGVIKRMFESVPRIRIMVGGNGPRVTWRLAALHADELNLDGLLPDAVADAMPVIASRCAEVGRDPGSLRVSVYAGPRLLPPGSERAAALRRYADIGVSRVICDVAPDAIDSRDQLELLARDVEHAGLRLQPA